MLEAEKIALPARILCCPDCGIGLSDTLACPSCRRSLAPGQDGIIDAMPAAMRDSTYNTDELQTLIEAAEPGEHGEKVVLYEKAFHDAQASYYDKMFADPLPLGEYYKQLVRRQIYSYVQDQAFVVDLCCGTGKSSIPLLERGLVIVAMDVSREMLRVYRRKCDAYGYQNVILVHADASRPPLLQESCGAILMIGGLHHIRDSAGAVSSCCTALKYDGLLILHEPLQTGKTSRLATGLENLYALTDPPRVWRAVKRRLGLNPRASAPTAHKAPIPDFTPYERPFRSPEELVALMPRQMETLALRSQGLLSFREFSPYLQGGAGALLAPWIVRLDNWLNKAGAANSSADALFAVFKKGVVGGD